MLLLLAFGLGIVSGLRSMTPPAVVAWAARLGHLELGPTSLGWLGSGLAAWIFTTAAVGELVADKLPSTPNRTAVGPFIARLLSGALGGGALAVGHGGSLAAGAVAGAAGAVVGTFGGYRARTGLVRALGTPDYLVALLEDAVAVGGAILLVLAAR